MSGYPVGKLNLDVEPGTIVGPDTAGQMFVAVGPHADGGTAFAFADMDDQLASYRHPNFPRSGWELRNRANLALTAYVERRRS